MKKPTCMTERMRAAALRGQAAALEMQEAAAEMLDIANEVEDYAERQSDALVRLRGPIPIVTVKPNKSLEAATDQDEERALAKIVGIVGPRNSGA